MNYKTPIHNPQRTRIPNIMNRKQLDTNTKKLCILAALTMSDMLFRIVDSIASTSDMDNEEDKQNIATEISGSILAGSVYGLVCVTNGITEPTAELLEGKGDITSRITQAIIDNAFTIVNDELSFPSEN